MTVRARRTVVGALVGGALGAALMYVFDPERGRHRRHLARARAVATAHGAQRRLGRDVHRSWARAHGLWHRTKHAVHHTPRPADDLTLTHRVESMIYRDRRIPKGRFSLNVEDGVVHLRGQLDTPAQIEAVEKATRKVPGVREVRNLLHLEGIPPRSG